jgi:phosphatidate cytidylyltransferase
VAATEQAPAVTSAPSGETPRRRGAGRDLTAAIAVGVGLGALALVSLFTARAAFLALLIAAVGLGVYEVVQALAAGGIRVPLLPLLAGVPGVALSAWYAGAAGLGIAFAVTVVVVVVWGLRSRARELLAGIALAAYLPLLAGCGVLLLVPDDGGGRVASLVVTVVCNDVGGYAAGVLAGRHRMAPRISPKKTWEGLAGSVVACVLAGIVTLAGFFGAPAWQGVVFGLVIVVTATGGDLAESLLKRRLGVKDMSSLLPGHGGVMDRLDSLLPSAPAALGLLSVFVPPPH